MAMMGILLSVPLLVAVAIAVKVTSGGPVLYRQRRIGRAGAEFTLLKFRTMQVNQSAPGFTASDDPRITRLGRWLRLLKLDELPQLFNIAAGEMSFVGPRPEVPGYVDLTNHLWRDVLRVRPGLTDPVTIRLRNEGLLMASAAGDAEKFYLETLQPYKLLGYTEFLRRRTCKEDVRVILLTLAAVIAPTSAPPPSIEEIRAVVAADRAGPGAPVTT